MNPSFTDTFETPIAVEFDGKTYTLERLKGRDYLDWIAELQKAYQDKNLPLIEQMEGSPTEKLGRKSQAIGREFTPDDCQAKIGTLPGAERVVRKSFVKAITGKRWQVDDATTATTEALAIADKFIDTLEWPDLLAMALRLSGLFLQEFFDNYFKVKPKDKADPKGGEAASAAGPSNLAGKSAA